MSLGDPVNKVALDRSDPKILLQTFARGGDSLGEPVYRGWLIDKLREKQVWEGDRMTRVVNFLRRDDGQGLTEYALILTLVAIATLAALTALGTSISSKFTQIVSSLG